MQNGIAKKIALGGIMAALAVVIMYLGGIIPVATFVCPLLCMILSSVVYTFCGAKIAWAWYFAVSLLCFLLGPDKEAALLFACLGYYPIIRPWFDRVKLGFLLKMLYFNAALLLIYGLMIRLLGFTELDEEYAGIGLIGTVIMLLLGNVVFLLLDRILKSFAQKGRRHDR